MPSSAGKAEAAALVIIVEAGGALAPASGCLYSHRVVWQWVMEAQLAPSSPNLAATCRRRPSAHRQAASAAPTRRHRKPSARDARGARVAKDGSSYVRARR